MQKLQSFHQELYQHALQATQHISAMNTTEIAEYSQDFYATLPSSFYNSDVHQLLKNVESAQFLIFGDFHTLPQSQRGFLNILIQVRRQYPARKLMVALEIFCANDQTSIDDFLNRKISEEDFLKKIDYLNKWGFPWDNYRHLVLFCKENSIRITGINSQFDTPNRLIRRDTYAADILNRWIENNPNDLCLCLIGEYHLADKHLIAHLNPLSRTIRVVNNVDEYYFRSSVLSVESTEYLELKKDFFCIQNSAPWVKWQSLAMWEELHSNGEGGLIDDCELYTEHHYDFDYQFLHILRSLNDFLKIELSSSELSLFELYIHPDQATLSHIKTKIKASRNEFAQLEQEAKINGYAYSSPSSTVIIMDPDITHFAEI
ncbi:MAG: ChaN family lipoprotein, partial [Proteobacteria bacterium]|nr:ChaN family lipoprotein [Pseudomonadota bacterium]